MMYSLQHKHPGHQAFIFRTAEERNQQPHLLELISGVDSSPVSPCGLDNGDQAAQQAALLVTCSSDDLVIRGALLCSESQRDFADIETHAQGDAGHGFASILEELAPEHSFITSPQQMMQSSASQSPRQCLYSCINELF